VLVETDPAGSVEPAGPAIVAVPAAMQGELNTTVTGVPEYSVPVWSTIDPSTVAEPPAPSELGVILSVPDLKALPVPLPNAYVVEVVPVPVVPVPVVVPVVEVPVPTKAALSLPPQELSTPIAATSRTFVEANFRMYHPNLMTVRPIPVPVSRR
jgi:hypothetical protein